MDFHLLDSVPDAMVIADAEGRIVFVNGHAERLFGYLRGELVGESIERLIPETYRREHVGHRRGYVAAARSRHMGAGLDLFARRKDGTDIPVEISLSPLRTPDGMLVVSAIRDISERKAAEAERAHLIQERSANAELNRIKDEFVATLSHELRTPLNAIIGWTSMLKRGVLDPARAKHAIETIDRNARAQAQLVEDLLDLSRVITGKLNVEPVPLELVEIVEAAADVVRPAAQANSIQLTVTAERRPVLLLADADRLQQAIWNLLTNAVKFTPEHGRIDVSVRVDDSTATIAVRDTGQGIDPAFLPHVFERFRQYDSSMTRQHGGLGLGLAIVRSLVEAHGGQVSACSGGLGLGSTFTIQLPISAAFERRSTPERSVPAPAHALDGVRVVVVDDAEDERELFSLVLEQSGASVRTAATAEAAITAIEEFRPDVVISDIAMPVHDGYALIRRLRSHEDPTIAQVPAIAVTAHARAEDRKRALAGGFQRYIPKPVDPPRLIETVAAVVAVRTPRRPSS